MFETAFVGQTFLPLIRDWRSFQRYVLAHTSVAQLIQARLKEFFTTVFIVVYRTMWSQESLRVLKEQTRRIYAVSFRILGYGASVSDPSTQKVKQFKMLSEKKWDW